jgi:hypothetical protein
MLNIWDMEASLSRHLVNPNDLRPIMPQRCAAKLPCARAAPAPAAEPRSLANLPPAAVTGKGGLGVHHGSWRRKEPQNFPHQPRSLCGLENELSMCRPFQDDQFLRVWGSVKLRPNSDQPWSAARRRIVAAEDEQLAPRELLRLAARL